VMFFFRTVVSSDLLFLSLLPVQINRGGQNSLCPVIRRVWARKGGRVHAACKTTYQWGYLHEALEVDGAHRVGLLLTPSINQDVHAVFLKQIAESDPDALHVVVMDQAVPHEAGERTRSSQHPCAAASTILSPGSILRNGLAVW